MRRFMDMCGLQTHKFVTASIIDRAGGFIGPVIGCVKRIRKHADFTRTLGRRLSIYANAGVSQISAIRKFTGGRKREMRVNTHFWARLARDSLTLLARILVCFCPFPSKARREANG